MRKKILLLLLIAPLSLCSDESGELDIAVDLNEKQILESLVSSTKQQLLDYERVLERLIAFQKQESILSANPNDAYAAEQLVSQAAHLLAEIEMLQLVDVLPEHFIEKLRVFARIANKS